MKRISAILLPFGFLASCSNSTNVDNRQQEASPEHPDVLFLAMDDLRDWTGYLTNFSDVKTPNLDRLAAESMIFSHAYCAARMHARYSSRQEKTTLVCQRRLVL